MRTILTSSKALVAAANALIVEMSGLRRVLRIAESRESLAGPPRASSEPAFHHGDWLRGPAGLSVSELVVTSEASEDDVVVGDFIRLPPRV